jgi:hypothetical protein
MKVGGHYVYFVAYSMVGLEKNRKTKKIEVVVVGSDHDQQHCYHHAPTVKPEAATAFVELLMMGMRTPETY